MPPNDEPPNDGPPGDEFPPPKRRLPLRYLRFPEPEPEDFLPSPPKIKGLMTRRPLQSALRPALLCFIGFWIASILHWRQDASLWAQQKAVLVDGEWWRLFTALFTHADMGHLIANTPLFLIFGWFLRAYFGLWVFPTMALVVGVLSNLWTIYLNEPQTRLVGASGMLYGMVAMWLVLYIRFATDYDVPMRIFRAIGVSLVLLFPTTFDQNTSYTAHMTGFAIGLLVALIVGPFLKVHAETLVPEPAPPPQLIPLSPGEQSEPLGIRRPVDPKDLH